MLSRTGLAAATGVLAPGLSSPCTEVMSMSSLLVDSKDIVDASELDEESISNVTHAY